MVRRIRLHRFSFIRGQGSPRRNFCLNFTPNTLFASVPASGPSLRLGLNRFLFHERRYVSDLT
ncbi:hypothetical protein KFK09_012164 [Dendrobium nobile]|uniref:Uncharacterized protein n=1 Tax=Dendrobium nobile TaxID=94219 RepID=A0A8T3BGK8_DENNO|nr:hypothetical protein KFK09_012164 [Dendrobium nobile]